ncbi:glycine betaine ABC transporter substrate-binding protein [Polaribacter batillariae]|uniref:Glycine betaine ABC transporter substrate-binding protein n=1 Tax=Polaribacter batillariae TaxID=2808900 RepID=A0ABX7SZH5_9FLAO|nr:glycine betaine ABC transporter substrate-binding protein [Polaribacter batillariae]QTD38903.1 glycine betaine ABC transporter substrate-binding protein [Polaribacter batillariae]
MKHKILQIGQIDLSFHKVAAAVVLNYFDSIGQQYQLHTAPHEELFKEYREGKIDLVLGAWLPSSHGKYIETVAKTTVKFSTLYNPFCIWGVPDYVPKTLVSSINDILKPANAEKFNKTIQGINEGAGISRFSRNIIKNYGLDTLGFKFKNGTIQDCTNAFIEAHKRKEWVIIPLWKPQFLFYSYSIRALEEPRGLLGTVDNATIIMHKNAVVKLKPKALKFIKKIKLGNQMVTDLDYQYQVLEKDVFEISKDILKIWN